MEDSNSIEICSGCGKIPRVMDRMTGFYVCSRCGGRSTIFVKADDYESVATDLDRKFHETILKRKNEEIKSQPLISPSEMKAPSRKVRPKKAKPKAGKKMKPKKAPVKSKKRR